MEENHLKQSIYTQKEEYEKGHTEKDEQNLQCDLRNLSDDYYPAEVELGLH